MCRLRCNDSFERSLYDGGRIDVLDSVYRIGEQDLIAMDVIASILNLSVRELWHQLPNRSRLFGKSLFGPHDSHSVHQSVSHVGVPDESAGPEFFISKRLWVKASGPGSIGPNTKADGSRNGLGICD